MTTFPIRHVLLLAGCALVTANALAQDDTADPKIDFDALDQSKDGYITRDELSADHVLLSRFVELDGNSDERLSSDELARMD